MSDIDLKATERVMKARAELILARKFYGVLVSNVEPVLSRKYPTMATNGKQHFYNPEFINGLDQEEVLGTQCHESEHDARHHGSRREGRDPVEWNKACDYAINIDLIDEGFKLPKGALIDEKYRGMSAEDIYRCRELDKQQEEKKKQEGQEKQEQDDADQDDNDSDNGDDDNDNGDESPNDDSSDDDSDDAGSDDDDQAGEQDGDDSPGNGPSDDIDDADEGEGGSAGDDAEGEGDDGDGDEAGSGEGSAEQEQQSSGDPGGCGEVLDSLPDDDGTIADEDIKWERNVRIAASMAKAIGQLPGHVSRDIERANNPPRDWRDELREFAEESGALRIETWNRPNRRFAHSDLVLPGSQKHGITKAVFIIDTSGSMDDIALACVNDESQTMLDDGIIDEIIVLYGDTQLNREDHYYTGDDIEFDPKGGGGTRLKPLFDHVAEHHDDASLIVCFTDLYIDDLGAPPNCPVMFAVTGYPDAVKTLIANAPWGARGIDVGAH